MAEDVPYWKQQMLDAQAKKEEAKKYPDLGKIVKFEGEYGVIILDTYHEGNEELKEQVVRWDTPREFDNEQYEGSPFQYEFIDNYEFKYINMDGTLKEQFKNS
jgi:hypothetical protein